MGETWFPVKDRAWKSSRHLSFTVNHASETCKRWCLFVMELGRSHFPLHQGRFNRERLSVSRKPQADLSFSLSHKFFSPPFILVPACFAMTPGHFQSHCQTYRRCCFTSRGQIKEEREETFASKTSQVEVLELHCYCKEVITENLLLQSIYDMVRK